MALPILRIGAEISFKGACGEPLNATGPQSDELLKHDAKHTLDMSQITKMMSEVSTAPPSPTMSFVRCISSECESVIDSPREEESEHTIEKKGIMWTVTRGTPPSLEKLESSLTEVKALYRAKFGKDFDGENVVEEDGISWTVTRGSPPSIEKLESSLTDIKALYRAKFGKDVDAVEEDGISWMVTRGAPPSIEKLESSLTEVKALYRAKFGKDVDGENVVEQDGISWMVTRGAPPSIEKLESSLAEVKALYKAKFGKDVEVEDSDSEGSEHAVEEVGISWSALFQSFVSNLFGKM